VTLSVSQPRIPAISSTATQTAMRTVFIDQTSEIGIIPAFCVISPRSAGRNSTRRFPNRDRLTPAHVKGAIKIKNSSIYINIAAQQWEFLQSLRVSKYLKKHIYI
jgi:hypothetical protein